MEKVIGLKELRHNVAGYANKVKRGQSFLVFRRSQPLFKITPVDDDEAGWERVIDFTKIKKGGVPIDEVLSRL